jgi:hypothetical protein
VTSHCIGLLFSNGLSSCAMRASEFLGKSQDSEVTFTVGNPVPNGQFHSRRHFVQRVVMRICVRYRNNGPPLWSSGQSSWLHNGDVLCFL